MDKKGTLFVYSGPSGVGKGTLLLPCLENNERMALSVSMTTRAPRPGERDGVDYYFVSRERFEESIAQGGFLEYACYSGNYYGTPRRMVEEQLAAGRDVVLEIEVQGAMQIKRTFPRAVFIFIMPPSFECLQNRLTGRGTETMEKVALRLRAAYDEIDYAKEYDYIIVNDDINIARAKLISVMQAAKCERRAMREWLLSFERDRREAACTNDA